MVFDAARGEPRGETDRSATRVTAVRGGGACAHSVAV
jgi:hypothetical protein